MNIVAIHTTSQIITKERTFNTSSSLLQMSNKYIISYHDNTITIQNWHGQVKMVSIPSLSCMNLRDYLILGTVTGKVLIYNLKGDLLCTFEAHYQMITGIEHNEYYLLTGCSDGSVKVWYLDQILSNSFTCVDEFMHSLGVSQIKLWDSVFYISSADKHLKCYKNKLIQDVTLEYGIVDFDIGIYGICVVLVNGEVGTFKNKVFRLLKTVEDCKHILWKGQNVVCSTSSSCYEFSLQGDLVYQKNADNICGIALLPMFKTLIGKKQLPILSKTVRPVNKILIVDQVLNDPESFIEMVLEK
eukprot:NODE_150_length_17275_cov_0.559618.p7 type:complete len:300 gc:universal NODE_150_length_17275_cov_0.559618:4591-3692(-)